MCDTQQESLQETPQTSHHENPQKELRKSSKGKTLGDKERLDEPRQSFYTYHERFIQGLASRLNIHPSHKISHEALKLGLRKTKEESK